MLALEAAAEDQIPGVEPSFSALIARCAPTVDPETMAALISAESRGHQYAIADAGPRGMSWQKRKLLVHSYYMESLDAAVIKSKELIASGHYISLGLVQISERNLSNLGLTIREVFEPCTNLRAGGKIITEFYENAEKEFGPGLRALRAAVSAYNSGDWMRGEKEGYVNLVFNQRGRALALQTNGGPTLNEKHRPTEKIALRTFTMSTSMFGE